MEKLNHDVSRQKNFKLKGQRENADCSVQNPMTVGRRNPKNSATQTKAWMKQRRSASSRTSTLDNKNEYHSRFTALKLRISDDFFIGTDLTCLRNTLCASTLLFCPQLADPDQSLKISQSRQRLLSASVWLSLIDVHANDYFDYWLVSWLFGLFKWQ